MGNKGQGLHFRDERRYFSQLGSEAAVPVHPKPIVEGGRVFGEDGGEPAL